MGMPKAELIVRGKPILQFLLERSNWPGPTLLITAPARQQPRGYELFSKVVADVVSGQGPLRGIATTLEASTDAELVIVTTCDMPMVTREMIEHLAAALACDDATMGLMCRNADGTEPFPLAIKPAALPAIEKRLTDGLRSLQSLATLSQFRVIDAPAHWPPAVWTNLNSPDDYRQFLAGQRD